MVKKENETGTIKVKAACLILCMLRNHNFGVKLMSSVFCLLLSPLIADADRPYYNLPLFQLPQVVGKTFCPVVQKSAAEVRMF